MVIPPSQVPQLLVVCILASVEPLGFSVRTWQSVVETFLGLTGMTALGTQPISYSVGRLHFLHEFLSSEMEESFPTEQILPGDFQSSWC